ncbi:hypothetical protein V6N13_125687 [Hibiscus sabdariffa]
MVLVHVEYFIYTATLNLHQRKYKKIHPVLASVLVLIGALCSFIYIFRTTVSWSNHTKNGRKLPPGPCALPIIGNLHMLGKLPHQNLHHLVKRYGSIMSLRLGSIPTIVVSSPQAAQLFLKTHDLVFASRPKIQASQYLSYGAKGMAFTPYGSYWRTVRKWCTLHLLSSSKVEYFAPVRKAHIGYLVESVKKASATGVVVDLSAKIGEFIEDVMCQIIFGRVKDDRFNLRSLIDQVMHLHGLFNISDFIPYLASLDIQITITSPSPYFTTKTPPLSPPSIGYLLGGSSWLIL